MSDSLFPDEPPRPPSRHPSDPLNREQPPNDAARRKRDEAMDRVERAADPLWLAQANAAIADTARAMPLFTTEDVWKRLDRPKNGKALGPRMRAARVAGLIKPSGQFKPTGMTSRNAAPVCVWESLIYRETA